MDLISIMVDFALRYSYLGIFIVSAVSNMVLFFPVPYLAALLILSSTVELTPWLMAIASGLGSSVGKLFAYLVGYGGRRLVKEEQRKNLDALARIVSRGGAIAALIVSATPLPDDIVLVPLGAMKYNVWKYWLAVVVGKTMLAAATCYFGLSISMLADVIGGNPWISATISIVIVIVGMTLVLKIDWIKLAKAVGEEGAMGVIRRIRREGWRWIFS